MKILITGASGFIGSFIVEEALRQGMETWAGVRASSSKRYLKDERIHFVTLDFSNKAKLKQQLQGMAFDYVVHAALRAHAGRIAGLKSCQSLLILHW